MDNPDEYVLQVFRRAQAMLEDELAPEHVAKLLKLGEKIAQAPDMQAEAGSIKSIAGFSKAGIAFEWLNARAKRDPEFNLDRFDSDVRLVYESLLEGFGAEPREAVKSEEASPRRDAEPSFAMPQPESAALPEPDWNSGGARSAGGAATAPAAEAEAAAPSFADLLDHPMLLTVRRLADSASVFDQKPEPERATSLAVLKMMAKSVVDMARPQNKVVVTGTFQEIAGLIESIERKGQARGAGTEKTITELGRILAQAMHDMASGIRYMNEINEFISERKDNGAK